MIGCGVDFDFVTRPRFVNVCRMEFNMDLRGAGVGGLRGAMVVLSVGCVVQYGDEGKDELRKEGERVGTVLSGVGR